jgi:hypothetical protein
MVPPFVRKCASAIGSSDIALVLDGIPRRTGVASGGVDDVPVDESAADHRRRRT